MARGKLIVIEGPDYAGKSTQIKLLVQALSKKGHTVFCHHFPQEDMPIGKAIYDLLNSHDPMVHERPDLFQHLYVADQYTAQAFLNQKLEEFDYVICDRYLYSTLAFGMANGLAYDTIREWQKGIMHADVLLSIYGDVEIFMARHRAVKDAHEKLEFQRRVAACYDFISGATAAEKVPVYMIEGTRDTLDIHMKILELLFQKE